MPKAPIEVAKLMDELGVDALSKLGVVGLPCITYKADCLRLFGSSESFVVNKKSMVNWAKSISEVAKKNIAETGRAASVLLMLHMDQDDDLAQTTATVGGEHAGRFAGHCRAVSL